MAYDAIWSSNMINQCKLTNGEWTTIGWVEQSKAVKGYTMNIAQRWFDGSTTKITSKIRPFTIVEVYQPAQLEDDQHK